LINADVSASTGALVGTVCLIAVLNLYRKCGIQWQHTITSSSSRRSSGKVESESLPVNFVTKHRVPAYLLTFITSSSCNACLSTQHSLSRFHH